MDHEWDDAPPPDLESDDDTLPPSRSLATLVLLIELLATVVVGYLYGYSIPQTMLLYFWGLAGLLLGCFLFELVMEQRRGR